MKTFLPPQPRRSAAATQQTWKSALRVWPVTPPRFVPRPGTGPRSSTSGIALVITLILLAVITFMAVAFLVLSQRLRSGVANTFNQTVSRQMADIALQRGLAHIMAPITGGSNAANFGLTVSTNYINQLGFVPLNGSSPTNVSYTYANGLPVTNAAHICQIANNLLYLPRAPVFIRTNTLLNPNDPRAWDFRYYLDLNRNGTNDPNGWLPEFEYQHGALLPVMVTTVSNGVAYTYTNYLHFVGDPEWVGIPEHPEYRHSANNPFVGRYAYIIIPASKTLDINYIHNYAKGAWGFPNTMLADGFNRNQGVGAWELNLAAFLADLNTNFWPYPVPNNLAYRYYPVYPVTGNGAPAAVTPNAGVAFNDAVALLRYRYWVPGSAPSYWNQANVTSVFGTNGLWAALNNDFDDLAAGPIMTTNAFFATDPDTFPGRTPLASPQMPYPAADNPGKFFRPGDYFDTNKTALGTVGPNFSTRLWTAGMSPDSYDRYTFYRLLGSLGTDSFTDPETKLNLNYVNVDSYGNVVPNLATNFWPWMPLQFFTNAANRLFANAGFTFSLGNVASTPANMIPVWPTNLYTPSVHRLLQLAANIYDSTTNRLLTGGLNGPYLPSVFQPQFGIVRSGTNYWIGITNYTEVTNANLLTAIKLAPFMVDLQDPTVADHVGQFTSALSAHGNNVMVYGVPLIVGAKKGLPNFNQFASQVMIQLTRKLEFRRPNTLPGTKVNETNQMLILCVSNVFGLEAWNSYVATYPRSLQVISVAESYATLTNAVTANGTTWTTNLLLNSLVQRSSATNLPANSWVGYTASGAYALPLNPVTNGFVLTPWTNETYLQSIHVLTNLTGAFERGQGFQVPQWWLYLRTRLRFILVDTGVQPFPRIVDYVNLESTEPPIDLTSNAMSGATGQYSDASPGGQWATNRASVNGAYSVFTPTVGILNQIGVSRGAISPENYAGTWDTWINGVQQTTTYAQNYFQGQIFNTWSNLAPIFYAPFEPTRTIYYDTSWAANDPLVHYTIGDLTDPLMATNRLQLDIVPTTTSTMSTVAGTSRRYRPWNPFNQVPSSNDYETWNLALKDPLVNQPDDWDFPANKYPNIGWLGRVHRGTPWQTVYLKAPAAVLGQWAQWSGHYQNITNFGQLSTNLLALYTNRSPLPQLNAVAPEALLTHPTNDYYLVDVFGTAINDNAARGQMSINQTNLAAWSAVLSGVDLLQTKTNDIIVQPAGAYGTNSPLAALVNGINNCRATNANGSFYRLGDIFKVPELTVKSPFILNTNLANDTVYERIPQQILGLLKGGEQPRFVVYAYGQALKPANNSLVMSGPYQGLCTNYQIVAETAARAVVRITGAPNNPKAAIESYTALPPE